MVAFGVRKSLKGDLEACKASVQDALEKRKAELDAKRFRQCVCWYDAKTNIWCEVEAGLFSKEDVEFRMFPDKPKRFAGFHVTETKQPIEVGFIGDGLPHVVWTGGCKLVFYYGHYYFFDQGKSKFMQYQCLVNGISKLPQIFFELYRLKISIPSIQQAFWKYKEGQAENDRH